MIPQRPVADPTTLAYPGRVYKLRHEVAAEGAPERAVLSGVDSTLSDAEDESDGRVGGAAGELGAPLDEAFVDEVGAGDDDECALSHLHGEDWSILFT